MNTNWKIFLLPLSFLYSIIIFIRNLFYDIRVFGVNRVNVPVISIGNLTAGGTGKTPVIEYLVNYFKRKNIKVAVISRGYKRNTKGTLVVSDGSSIIAKPEQAGDEPYQIAVRFQEAVVIVDENRFRGAKLAVEKYKPEVILLDDSFQHRRIHRDLDIVLIDVTKPPHKEYMLPAGLRREPLSSLKRTNVLLFTRW
ncbi:MAG: tetraacyldisaccharide 4'-kinase, partial [Bacteroidota bacterium]